MVIDDDEKMTLSVLQEPGVLEYIANKLFSFEEDEVDFYLPQLVNMYIMIHAVAEVVKVHCAVCTVQQGVL